VVQRGSVDGCRQGRGRVGHRGGGGRRQQWPQSTRSRAVRRHHRAGQCAVGASSHMGTIDRADDTIAVFSSRGPTAIDRAAKPDLVAPGVGIESLSDPASAFYTTKAAYLLSGTATTSYLPYLSLSGTSMAAPVVSGTVALMLQANPTLTPNAVKAILEYTAETNSGYDKMTQGAGFLNARGAVEVARSLASESGGDFPDSSTWSRHLIWGN